MRTTTFKIVVTLTILLGSSLCFSLDTSDEEKACRDIGFTKKNPQLGECVLELLERKQAFEAAKKANAVSQLSYRSSPPRPGSTSVWDLRQIANSSNQISYLNRPDSSVYETLKVEDAKSVVAVANAIGRNSGIRPTLFLLESSELNAGATFNKDGKPIIIINKPMMDLIKDDPDMAAALLGHEMAHLYLRHPGATAGADAAGSILGLLAGIALEIVAQNKLGVTNLGLQGGQLIGTAFSTSFTRDQERDADRLGLIWAKQDGYDPNGAIKLFKAIESKSGNTLIPFFQSHPNPSERIENAQRVINGGG
ncbi:M48 family metallopeptidase [Polynucleobacter sp. AP-Reno-20A-A9]|uniref:M48 family metallopeptidase n=1 Tax=Polynucleobacter sp. AP-Reno-20A-A9 TaxID=2576925 RepID=UPI001C0CDDAA|nr:M48 family metallopeptidase [Polynucleobacter sp. AP-Reno-20A-A9]MBU3628523.1 M48 family metallopeptidase [Polynucleobacter sp. AP-Reno-20A-A9]